MPLPKVTEATKQTVYRTLGRTIEDISDEIAAENPLITNWISLYCEALAEDYGLTEFEESGKIDLSDVMICGLIVYLFLKHQTELNELEELYGKGDD